MAGNITSQFGPRWGTFHGGIDIAAEAGTPIRAARAGVVREVAWSDTYGLYVLIDHGNGMWTRYAHASEVWVTAGDAVEQGNTIALVGSTGFSTGPHLHFEIFDGTQRVDPLTMLP